MQWVAVVWPWWKTRLYKRQKRKPRTVEVRVSSARWRYLIVSSVWPTVHISKEFKVYSIVIFGKSRRDGQKKI